MNKKKTHKLKLKQKQEIWDLYNEDYSPTEIAEKFDVSPVTIYRIGKGERPKQKERS